MKATIKQAVGFIAGCLLLASCSVAKKDQRALDRVQAKRPLIDKMVPVVMGLYPCITDTIAIVLPGGVDSVFYPVPQIDTVHDRGTAYAEGFADGQRSITRKRYAKPRPDTLRLTVVDRQALNIALNTIEELRIANGAKDQLLKACDKKTNGFMYWAAGLLFLLAVTNAYWITRKH